jgi:hypothetical protein
VSLRTSLHSHALRIATIVGVALLVITANLESPRWWLTLPGWLILAACVAIRFERIPNESPYRQAAYLMGLPLLFYFGLWTGTIRNLFKLIFEPSGSHLYTFLTTRSFLVLLVLYFASVCLFYGINLQKLRDQLLRLEDRHKNSPTLTMSEAEEILDITSRALQDESDLHYHRVSLLQGYDVFQIDKALKLRIANEFLYFADRDDGFERFTEGLNTYSGIPFSIPNLFVPDDQLARLEKLSPDSPDFFKTKLAIMPSMLDSDGNFKDSRLASLETADSFGNFCRSIGARDPNYWKKVYQRIGLEHTSTSPQGNEYCYVALPDD